jgi:Ca2+-binding EF-hand superfamily protein
MNLKPLIALALASAALLAGPLGRAADGAEQRFDELDRNHDGFLSRDESNDARELDTRFSELDVDNDGKLSREEYRIVVAGERETLPGAATAGSPPPTASSGATRP